MADSADGRKSDCLAKTSVKYLDGNTVKYRSSVIGAAWYNESDVSDPDTGEVRKVKRINVKLDSVPVNGDFILWPNDRDDHKPSQ